MFASHLTEIMSQKAQGEAFGDVFPFSKPGL